MYGTCYSTEPDLMEDMKDLHIHGIKKNVYMLIVDGQMRACTTKSDMDKHLSDSDALLKYNEEVPEDTVLLYGLLLDPTSLPYEIPPTHLINRKLYLLVEDDGDIEYSDYDEIEEVTEGITDLMETNKELEIENFIVFLAQELEMCYSVAATGDSVTAYQVLGEH